MALTVPSKRPRAIVGPIISDIASIAGNDVTLATAFYTAGALNVINIDAKRLRLLMRLNTKSVADWAMGSLDPVALRTFIERHRQAGGEVSLLISPTAHAKIYSGQNGYLVGSANLSTRALSGSAAEVLWFESDTARKKAMELAVEDYSKGFSLCTLAALDAYIATNESKVKALAKKIPRELFFEEHDRLPQGIVRPPRLGDYDAFLEWLSKHPSPAAKEVLARANGKSNLSGHIRQAFFGLRQFFLGSPSTLRDFTKVDPDGYSFSGDNPTASKLGAFVTRHARDEGPFAPKKWQTYLPKSAGGKQITGGATSGNLNRMFPLLAQYLNITIGRMQ
ncbi:MAG: hypothetical protein H6905_11455 [Hyphomicrobiales bacterium]|uniref:hypothetical protein n=1 Tax=Brevundimonas sp. 357 TaxID=2555782 RepID=UPI000F7A644D|nr:hypothetical protein [Brevundimonas sp. 357]MCP5365823.1 hypothetical protein [Hyphomicrobiales bacterium]